MSYTTFHSIIVHHHSNEEAKRGREVALEIGLQATDIVRAPSNNWHTFLIPPDGSKEDWTESDEGDRRRAEFCAWVEAQMHDDGSNCFQVLLVDSGHREWIDQPPSATWVGRVSYDESPEVMRQKGTQP